MADIAYSRKKQANILIYGSGRACISDFGLSIVATNVQDSSLALTYQVKGTLCWTAPELLATCDPESEDENENQVITKIFPTVQSDIYSFGGIMFQVRVTFVITLKNRRC